VQFGGKRECTGKVFKEIMTRNSPNLAKGIYDHGFKKLNKP
jgi:hypothetical protein